MEKNFHYVPPHRPSDHTLGCSLLHPSPHSISVLSPQGSGLLRRLAHPQPEMCWKGGPFFLATLETEISSGFAGVNSGVLYR